MTIEQVALMTADEAQRATERIRLKLDSAANVLDSLAALVADAYQRRADLALGYDSWAEYSDAEFAEQTRNLAAPIRRELVGRLTEAGMSTRAIAPTVGTSFQAVHQMERRRQVSTSIDTSTPDPLAEEKAEGPVAKLTGPDSLFHAEPVERIDYDTGEVLDETPVASTVTGLDGKTYTRPTPQAPAKPKRRPLPDVAHDAAVALTDAVERVERSMADDRFPQNREQVARLTRNHLLKAIETLQRLAEELSN